MITGKCDMCGRVLNREDIKDILSHNRLHYIGIEDPAMDICAECDTVLDKKIEEINKEAHEFFTKRMKEYVDNIKKRGRTCRTQHNK